MARKINNKNGCVLICAPNYDQLTAVETSEARLEAALGPHWSFILKIRYEFCPSSDLTLVWTSLGRRRMPSSAPWLL